MEFKKCSGYHGKCYHSPDKIVPVGGFGKMTASKDGLHHMCRSCKIEEHKVSNVKNNARMPRHPDTEKRKMHWKSGFASKLYGGMPKARRNNPRWDECMAKAEEASKSINWKVWDMNKNRWVKYNSDIKYAREEMGVSQEEYRTLPLETRKTAEGLRDGKVVRIAHDRFDDGSPQRTRKPSKRLPTGATKEGPGFVYIYQDERIPEDLKVGAEKEDQGRLANAGTWGFYRCIFNAPFEKRFEAEAEVHKILNFRRIVSNKEFFKCSVLEAQVAIETVALRYKTNAMKVAQKGAK